VTSVRELAASYCSKVRVRRKALEVYLAEQDISDVVREAQEIVELTTKAEHGAR
jgi:hypothetical protein